MATKLTTGPDGEARWKIFIHCVPPRKTHQQTTRIGFNSRSGKAVMYTKKGLESTWVAILHPHAPPQPMAGPLELRASIIWPWNKSDPQRLRRKSSVPHHRRPDLDNVWKSISDAMTTTGWWQDDSQVCALEISKYRGESTGLYVDLRQIIQGV